jgi:hypothetical protein
MYILIIWTYINYAIAKPTTPSSGFFKLISNPEGFADTKGARDLVGKRVHT